MHLEMRKSAAHSAQENNMTCKLIAYLLTLYLTIVSMAAADQTVPQKAPTPCRDVEEFRQLDFWVGEWEVTASGQKAGASSVQSILDGCVIFENWTGMKGFNGKSFNLYNAKTKKWEQHWVDNQGTSIDFIGSYADGKMQYESVTVDAQGAKRLGRMTFSKLPDGNVRQLWEQSSDGGKTWRVAFDGLYSKRK